MGDNEKVIKVVWTRQGRTSLNKILDYRYKEIPTARKIIRTDIIKASKTIIFPKQYQKDDIYSQYRKIKVRDYKILYRESKKIVYVMNVISTLAESKL